MKTFISPKMKAVAKKAFTIGFTAMLLVSCGKDKNTTDENNNANAFTNGLAPGQVCPSGTNVRRIFDFSNGTLTQAGQRGGTIYATYLGVDVRTGDSAVIRDYGSNIMQLDLTVVCTGDTNFDNILLSNQPQIVQTFSGDLNVANKAACPGRINAGTVRYGTAFNNQLGNIPVISNFEPPQECY